MNQSSSESREVIELEDPYSLFVFAMNAAQTREKYITRLDRFLRFIEVRGGCVQERCRAFADAAKKDNKSALNNVLKFLQVYNAGYFRFV